MLFVASVFACSLSLTTQSNAAENAKLVDSATIDFVKGYAIVIPNQSSELALFARRDMFVSEGDLLRTGRDGFISISFHSKSVVHIQPSSEIIIENISCDTTTHNCSILINALSGSMNSDVVSKASDKPHFTIKTPYASAAVRGTVFDVDIINGRVLAGVTEGLININAQTDSIDVPENFGLAIEKDQPPSALTMLPPEPAFIPGAVRFESLGEFEWDNIASAAHYIVSLHDTTGLAYRTVQNDTSHKMQELNVGSYTAFIRAVDADGFKGPAALKALDIVKLRQSVNGPEIAVSADNNRFEITTRKSTVRTDLLELHFSPTKNFEHLTSLDISRDDNLTGDQAANTIYVRARGILSNTEVTPFGPVVEIPATR